MLYDVTNSRLIVVENIHGDFNEIIGCSTIVFQGLRFSRQSEIRFKYVELFLLKTSKNFADK